MKPNPRLRPDSRQRISPFRRADTDDSETRRKAPATLVEPVLLTAFGIGLDAEIFPGNMIFLLTVQALEGSEVSWLQA